MDHKPLVSILAACFNHSQFVEETLDSILNQSYSNIELIITDDGSKDDSVDIINEWIKKNAIDCTFIINKKNKGVCKTFNKGLEASKGIYFQVISCDDIMLPNKIEEQVALLEKSEENVAVVYSDAEVIDENSKKTHSSFYDFWGFENRELANFEGLLKQNTIIAPSVLVKRTALVELGGYDENLCYEDWDMWLRLGRVYKFIKQEKALVQYRHFSTSMSQGKTYRKAMLKDNIRLLEKHRGISKEMDALVDEAQRPNITALIEHNDATTSILWKKFRYEKSIYSFYMFFCSSLGIDQAKAHRIKSKLKKTK